jgi:hypothetical protein
MCSLSLINYSSLIIRSSYLEDAYGAGFIAGSCIPQMSFIVRLTERSCIIAKPGLSRPLSKK